MVYEKKQNNNDGAKEALNKFIELYGDEVIDRETNEEYIKKVIELTKKHYDKYKNPL